MTTSGTYSFTVTRDQIIRQAMLNIGAIDPDEAPDATEVSDIAFVLNMLVKQWQGKGDFGAGLKVWTRRRGHLYLNGAGYQYTLGPAATGWSTATTPANTTTAATQNAGDSQVTLSSTSNLAIGYSIGVELSTGVLQWTTISNLVGSVASLGAALTASVNSGAQVFGYQTVGTQPINLEAVVLRDNQNNDTPIKILTQQEYDSLPAKTAPTNTSDPAAVYLEFQLGNSYLYTDVAAAADVTKHLVLTFLESIQDFNNPLDNPEYPQEYYLALCWGLSKQIITMFPGKAWTNEMQGNYTDSVLIAKKKDPELAVAYFQPGAD